MNSPVVLPPMNCSALGRRMHAELDTAKQHLEAILPSVAIYGGSRVKPEDRYYAAAHELAAALSARGVAVMSGGGPGIMEAAAKGTKAGGKGLSIGLNITLPFEQSPNEYQDLALTFEHFSSRKTTFCKYANAFIVMPGGFGTLDELFEVLTLIQTGKSPVAPVILYGREFWQGLLAWMQQVMLARGWLSGDEMELIAVADSVDDVLELCVPSLKLPH